MFHWWSFVIKPFLVIEAEGLIKCRADSRLAPSQWETLLQSNAVSHWLGLNLESAIKFVVTASPIGCCLVWSSFIFSTGQQNNTNFADGVLGYVFYKFQWKRFQEKVTKETNSTEIWLNTTTAVKLFLICMAENIISACGLISILGFT